MPSSMMTSIRYRLAGLLALLAVGACASVHSPDSGLAGRSAAPATSASAPAAAAVAATSAAAHGGPDVWAREVLEAPASAVRTAQRITLAGNELGTMWTFENAPLDYWEATYGFRPTQEWLDHVRQASIRIPGCSASFVSGDGLILTNHHCARGCIAANSTPANDYVIDGFYAGTRAEEKVCPNAFADVLVGIEDVTQRVRAEERPGMTSAQIAEATQQATQAITAECQQATGQVCRVVPLFRGGQYQLYTYRRHTPVKLVMAPELQAGYFGGDHDNFVYPRYALDFAFYRAYEPDGVTPVKSPYYFPFDPTGPEDGELVFVTGNPGSTARMITLAQLMYERSYRHPMMVNVFDANRRLIRHQLEAATGQQVIALRERLFGVENSLKKYQGEVAGLMDSMLVATKVRWEQEFRDRARTTPDAAAYLDVWDRIYELQLRKVQLDPARNASNAAWLGSQYLTLPANILALHRSAALPEEQRPAQLRGEQRVRLEQLAVAPVANEALAAAALEAHFALAADWLPPGHPLLAHFAPARESPVAAAQRLAAASRILDPAFRQELLHGGMQAFRASADPAIRLALVLDSVNAATTPQFQALLAEEAVQVQRLARALFAVYGTRLPPDATSSLRISDGVVRGYPYNSTIAPYKSVFHGMFARAAEFNSVPPFDLPPLFAARQDHINMTTPVDFVSTNDITGGNSGSPIIDRHARVVGLAFDGNVEQLPNEYVFRTETGGRTVAVHSAGILEALRSIYQAQALLDELLRSR
jgi:V8-like Glu-specific endopeptidase